MSGVRLSPQAQKDLVRIARYSRKKFGARTAQAYIQGIHDVLAVLMANPGLGVEVKSRRQNRHRHPHRQHVVFYEIEPAGILVLRIYPMPRLLKANALPD